MWDNIFRFLSSSQAQKIFKIQKKYLTITVFFLDLEQLLNSKKLIDK